MPRGVKNTPVEDVDPFADEPGQDNVPGGDEAQTEMPPPWEVDDKEEEKTVENPKQVVEFAGGDRLSVTLKQGKGYEAAWIVLKGDTPADILNTMQDENFKKLMTWTKSLSNRFQEGSETSAPSGNTNQGGSGYQGRTQGKPAAATAHPKGRQEFCQHGEMEFKSGLGKNGKMWGGFDCKVDPKGCARKWDNDFGK